MTQAQSAAKAARAATEFASASAGIMPGFWALLAVYAVARGLSGYPRKVAMVGVMGFPVLPPAIFTLIHGSVLYRVRPALIFVVLYLVVGNIFENLGVATGFPFGSYYFTDVMGPKLFHVPILLGLAYVGIGYASWMLALLIL